MCFSLFSRKAKVDALMVVEHSIKVQLETFTNHLQTVQMDYDNLMRKTDEIIALLKEKNKNGQ